ncbi:CAP domain-containing protein [Loktanella sp. DJP18]|uniref:CAP domain-containing protein n=1 Tax=Loktanella sp. DJP18 TaxID=3409788 RepID=UPI003BB6CFF5
MMSRFSALILSALLALSACVPVPVPLIVPLSASGAPVTDEPVQRLGATAPLSPAVDAALNEVRADNGQSALVSNGTLDRVAAQYAAELAQGDKLMMGLSTGARAGQRIKAAGVSGCTAGEVISQGYPTAQAALSAWLSNPQQRRVLLNPAYVNYGFGHAVDLSGRGADVWVIVLLMACAA